MHGDMFRAWLLVINAMAELELVQVKELPSMADAVNTYISNSSRSQASQQNEIKRAEKLMGIQNPYGNLDPNMIKSPVELVKFKKKVFRVATHTALCVICLGLEATAGMQEADVTGICEGKGKGGRCYFFFLPLSQCPQPSSQHHRQEPK